MKRLKSLTRLMRLGTAAAVCLIVAWPVCADDAAKDKPATASADKSATVPAGKPATAPADKPPEAAAEAPKPLQAAPAPVPAEPPAPSDPLENELAAELSKLQKMEAELKAVESVAPHSAAAPAVKPPVVKPAANPDEVPKEPVKGLEAEFADALYAVGKYDLARAAYQRIIESKAPADVLAWARLQTANCARHSGDLQAAGAAYEALMNASPSSPWAAEATWWAGEVKWWLLWGQNTK